MGVPKLFRYLTERYPSLCQTLSANQLPEYDYFYIDLNHLIHKAVNPRGALPLEQVDEEFYTNARIFERILRYIETLHRIVPSKVLFLSIDGVAPRAKWSTQRLRRLNAIEKNSETLASFDSNRISPGTAFMNDFEAVLLEFVLKQIKLHRNWQNCSVYISGSNCPGEGSIKIIDFIRSLKQSETYKPNATHCVYSGDNDYLMLGIAARELHVTFLQERKSSPLSLSSLCSDDVKHQFSVIHFELLRQYIGMEFVGLQHKLKFDFDLDSVLDDWVLLMTLIGNDYIPGLPKFDLEANIISVIYDAYKELLKSSNGYITECGILNIRRFARLLQILKPKDFDLYCESAQNSANSISVKLSTMSLGVKKTKDNGKPPSSFSDFLEMKDCYYGEHLGNESTPDFKKMSTDYVESIQWILMYYYRGIPSWTYFYPHSFAPFVSDLTAVQGTSFSVSMEEPDDPYTHLLAILPKANHQLLPYSYRPFVVDEIDDLETLLNNAKRADSQLNAKHKELNQSKPMLKLQFVHGRVKIIELQSEKHTNMKYVKRPIDRNDFNARFSTLYMHEFSFALTESTLTKPYPRMVLSLKSKKSDNIDEVAREYLNQSVYVNWPHLSEAKVVQVFTATKKFDGSTGDVKITDNPDDFKPCVDALKTRYDDAGIEVGEIKMIAFIAPLKYVEYKPKDSHTYELVKCWDCNNWRVVAVQSLIKSFMKPKMPPIKLVKDEIDAGDVFLFGGKTHYYGERAEIVDASSLETNGRVNILSHKDAEPNFDEAKQMHVIAKQNELNEFKQRSTAATILGISERVLARITGTVLVSPNNSIDLVRKINIGLQFKSHSMYSGVTLLNDYVKNVGKQFVYSVSAIGLVQQYMDKFPRVFELLSGGDDDEKKGILISDFNENNNEGSGLEYLSQVLKWLQGLPHSKIPKRTVDLMQFSDNACTYIKKAIDASRASEPKILKLKMKWQNLYIPDLNSVFANPSSEAVFKLLDRIVIVCSGYPFPIGSKGTVIGIEPVRGCLANTDITDDNLYALEIQMDTPFKIDSEICKFKQHQVFRTRSTNMLINMSHGRIVD